MRIPAPAGSFPANAWGLHDMHGNVFEWVRDCWNGSTYEGAPSDGSAWLDGDCTSRVIRGGAWSSSPGNLRSANRIRNSRGDRRSSLGFRVARALPPAHPGVVPLFPAAAEEAPQGFVRVINHSEVAGQVRIDAFDDSGMSYGPVALFIDAGVVVQFNSDDLERGNAAKGLPDGIGSGLGGWRLQMSTILDVDILSYIRTPDGFLTAMRQTVPANEGRHRVSIFNPGRNRTQASRLRLINPGEEDSEVTITGADDHGRPGGTVSLSIAAGESRTISAQQLEAGSGDLDGGLGAGKGKWHLTVVPSAPILVMNLLESPTGHLTNLSTPPAAADEGEHFVPLFPPKSSLGRQGFLRVINLSDASGEVLIYAFDDDDSRHGLVSLTLDAGAAAHVNSEDLEDGNISKGLFGSTGAGVGDWRLELTSDLEIEVLAYVRTDDGFVTAIHDIAPQPGESPSHSGVQSRQQHRADEPVAAGESDGGIGADFNPRHRRRRRSWRPRGSDSTSRCVPNVLRVGSGIRRRRPPGFSRRRRGQVAARGGIRTAHSRHEPARKPHRPPDEPFGRKLPAFAPGYRACRFR